MNSYHLVFVHGGVCFQCSAGAEHLPAILFSFIQLFYNMSSPQHVILSLSYQLSVFLSAVINLAALLITRCVLLVWLCATEHIEIGMMRHLINQSFFMLQ